MKLVDMKVDEFCNLLASSAPAPGGGSVAALEGALGAALVNMVVALTVGKKKYAEYWNVMEEIKRNASAMKADLLDSVDKDTEAFNEVSAVFAMPKTTEEEKASKSSAMQRALKLSTETPIDTMVCALAVLEVAKTALGKSNTNAISDLGVAALSLKAAVQGAWLNVLINISDIRDDEFVKKYKSKGLEVLVRAENLADEIYNIVLDSLN